MTFRSWTLTLASSMVTGFMVGMASYQPDPLFIGVAVFSGFWTLLIGLHMVGTALKLGRE